MTPESKFDDEPDSRVIHCARHGIEKYCLICQHLCQSNGLAYWAIQAEPELPAQAWCAACDAVLEQERGWSDRAIAQAGWKHYCALCYEETLESHNFLGWVEGTTEEDFQ